MHVVEGSCAAAADVVDHDVDTAEALHGRLDDGHRAPRIGDVRNDADRLPGARDRAHRFVEIVGAASAENDPRTLVREPKGDSPADAAARPGDDRDLVSEPEIHASILEVRYPGHAATRMEVTRPTLSHDRLCRLQDGDVDPELGELDRRVAVLVLEGAPRALDSDDHHSAPRASTTKQSWVKGVSPDPESSSCASRTHGF